jgi:hypothetical protein
MLKKLLFFEMDFKERTILVIGFNAVEFLSKYPPIKDKNKLSQTAIMVPNTIQILFLGQLFLSSHEFTCKVGSKINLSLQVFGIFEMIVL